MTSETSIKVIVFSGKIKDWSVWEEKYLAKSQKKGYKAIFTGKVKVTKEEENETAEEKKKREKIEETNEDAFSDLILSFADTEAGNVAFSIVRNAKTKDLPDGDAFLAWTNLKKKFAPQTAPTEMSLYSNFHSSKLQSGEDPDIWICHLEDLRIRLGEMGTKMEDRLFLMHILNNLTMEYENTIQMLEKRNSSTAVDPLTLEELRADLNLKYERMEQRGDTNRNENDAAFYAGGKMFKGKCNKCGKLGHKSFQCKVNMNNNNRNNSGNQNPNGSNNNNGSSNNGNTNNNNSTQKFTGICNYCKKYGHKWEECRNRLNKNNKPNDKGYSATEGNSNDLVLMSFDTCHLISLDKTDSTDIPQSLIAPIRSEEYIEESTMDILQKDEDNFAKLQMSDSQSETSNDKELPWTVVKSNKGLKINKEASQLIFFKYDKIKTIACKTHIRINGTQKQQLNLQQKDFEKFIETYAIFCFKINTPKFYWYSGEMKKQLRNANITSVISILNNIFYLNTKEFNKITFTKQQLNVIQRLGVEWIHSQQPSKLYMLQQPIYLSSIDRSKTKKTDTATPVVDMVNFSNNEKVNNISPNFWLGDSGASCHMTNNDEAMFDCTPINSRVQCGNGGMLNAEKIGKIRLNVQQVDGTQKEIVLEKCKYVPGLTLNLFSILKALDNQWNISNEGTKIKLKKMNDQIVFDRIITTDTGIVAGVNMVPKQQEDKLNKAIDINSLHAILGHPSEIITRNTAKANDIKITGNMQQCHECALAKIKQQKIARTTNNKSTIPGERLCIDISSVKNASYGGAKFWLMIIDDATRMCWSTFLKHKSDTSEKIVQFVKELKAKQYIVKYIRCDNAGENQSLQKECDKLILNIQFEFTGPNTPQYNGKVERRFATLYGRVRAILNEAKLTENIRNKLWAEACNHATNLENKLINIGETKSAYELFYNKKPPKLCSHQFGELAVVQDTQQIKSKMTNKGKTCMFVGQTTDHPEEVYKFLNLQTKQVIRSRNVIWLNKLYAEYNKVSQNNIVFHQPHEESSDEEEEAIHTRNISPVTIPENLVIDDDEATPIIANTRMREVRGLVDTFNTGYVNVNTRLQTRAQKRSEEQGRVQNLEHIDDDEQHRDYEIDEEAHIVLPPTDCLYGSFHEFACSIIANDPTTFKDVYTIPDSFEAAWYHADLFQREHWRTAIRKEFSKMNKMRVWRKIDRSLMPNGRRCVKCRWVFDIKRDGTFRARLVACGYSQVPGIDFTEVYSPVKNDVTFRILLVMVLLYNYDCYLIDVVTAFLHGELLEEIYMECPSGLKHTTNEILLLQKSIYGLVQSARQFFKKLVTVLKSIGFVQNIADPCLLCRKTKTGYIAMVVHVDDCFTIGNKQEIENMVQE